MDVAGHLTRRLDVYGSGMLTSLFWGDVALVPAVLSCLDAGWSEKDWLTHQPWPYVVPSILSIGIASLVRARVISHIRDTQDGRDAPLLRRKQALEMGIQLLAYILLDAAISLPFGSRTAGVLSMASGVFSLTSCHFLTRSWSRAGSPEQKKVLRRLALPYRPN